MCLGCCKLFSGDIGIANVSVDATNENARARNFDMLVGIVKILSPEGLELDYVQQFYNNVGVKLVVRENRSWSGGVRFTYTIPLSEFTFYSLYEPTEVTKLKEAMIKEAKDFAEDRNRFPGFKVKETK